MAIPITEGSGTASVATETIAGISYQQIEVYGAGGASILAINPDGSINASIIGTLKITGSVQSAAVANQSVSGTVGASIIGTVPVTFAAAANQSVSGAVGMNVPIATSTFGVTSVMTQTTSVLVLAAPPALQRNYITHVLVTNAAATVTNVSLIDNGNVIWSGIAGASGGGWSENFSIPLAQPTSVKALYAVSSVQASVIVAANGFTGA